MTIEDRLLALAIHARRTGGLHDPAALTADLIARAPDLADEIRALVAALGRLDDGAGGDADDLARTIAAARHVPLATATMAAQVALLVGDVPRQEPPEPFAGAADAWYGDGVVVPPDAPPPYVPPTVPLRQPAWVADAFPPPPAAPKPWEQPWFYLVIGAVLIVAALAYSASRTGTRPEIMHEPPPPSPTPTASATGTGQTDDADALQPGGPTLSTDRAALPTLSVRRAALGALGIGFSILDGRGPVRGLLVLPPGGWDADEATLIGQRDGATSIGSGRFERSALGAVPMRILRPRWRQDGLGAGPACVLIGGQPGAVDVALQGARMCLGDAQCERPVGCGIVP